MRKQRKLKYRLFYRYNRIRFIMSRYKLEPIQDLVCLHGIDIEAELLTVLSAELRVENSKFISDYLDKMLGKTNEEAIQNLPRSL